MSALLSDQDVALEELSRAYDSTAPDKVPAPGSAGRGALSSLSCDAAPGTPLSSSLPLGEGGAAYAETDEGASFRRADQYRTGESEICTCPPRSLNDLMWEKTDRGSRIPWIARFLRSSFDKGGGLCYTVTDFKKRVVA